MPKSLLTCVSSHQNTPRREDFRHGQSSTRAAQRSHAWLPVGGERYAYGYLVGNRLYHAVAGVVFVCWLATRGWRAYLYLPQLMAGLDYITWGLISFVVAVFISLLKMGVPQRWYARWTREGESPPTQMTASPPAEEAITPSADSAAPSPADGTAGKQADK